MPSFQFHFEHFFGRESPREVAVLWIQVTKLRAAVLTTRLYSRFDTNLSHHFRETNPSE